MSLGKLLHDALAAERQELTHIGAWNPDDPEILIDGDINLETVAARFAAALKLLDEHERLMLGGSVGRNG